MERVGSLRSYIFVFCLDLVHLVAAEADICLNADERR